MGPSIHGALPGHPGRWNSKALSPGLSQGVVDLRIGESLLSLAQSPCPVPSGTRESTSSTILAFRPIAAGDGQQLTTGDGQQLLTTRSRGHSGRPSRSTDLSRNGAASHQRCADTRSTGPRSLSVSRARDLPTFGSLV